MENSKNISYGSLLPITLNKNLNVYELEYDDFYTITDNNGFRYYRVDIKYTDFSKLEKIINACKEIEDKSWNAQDDFYEYIRERDLLIYILKNNKLAGFLLLSYWVSDNHIIFGFDETMVKKAHRGANLALAMCGLAARTLYIKFSKQKKIRYVIQVITPNLGVIKGMHKYRFLFVTMANAFKPDNNLMKIHDKLLLREKKQHLLIKIILFFLQICFQDQLKRQINK